MSSTTNGLWTEEFSKISATLGIFQDNGVTAEHFKKLRSDKEFASHICNFITGEGLLSGVFHREIRKVMGKNIWGPEEWSHYFDENFSSKELESAMEMPWSKNLFETVCPFADTQKFICETHFLFWLPPGFEFTQQLFECLNIYLDISTIEVRDKFKELMRKDYEPGWYLILLDSCAPLIKGDPTTLGCKYAPTDILLELTKQVLFKKLHGRPNISGFSSHESVDGICFYISENFPPSQVNIHHDLDWTRSEFSAIRTRKK